MQVLQNIVQGSREWLAIRAKHHTASEAPAMMGASRYQTRDQLLHQKHTGITQEIDGHTQALFDRGHATEAAARLLLEQEIGEELYPVTALDDAGRLLASFDGITLMGDTGFEHKLWSERLAGQVRAGDLEPHYYWQLEQQILVGGLEKVIFVTSDGTRENWAQMTYYPVAGRAEALLAGWAQFDADLAVYAPPAPKAAPVVAAPTESLPAVSVRVDGQLAIVSNLPAFGAALRSFIARIPVAPSTDQEFADTEAACKSLKQAEDALKAAENNALAQADMDAMRRAVADCLELARSTRLKHEKLVVQRKEQLRGEIVAGGVAALHAHIDELNARIGRHWMPTIQSDFGGAVKGKRNLDSLQGAVNDELARCKIIASEIAGRIQTNQATILSAGHQFLFSDAQQLTLKPTDDCAAVVRARVIQHQAAEQQRMDAERERIRSEEAAKLEREADAKARAEAAELARQQREQAAAQQQAAAAIAQAATPASLVLSDIVTISNLPACINLGDINAYLAPIKLDAAGLSALGFEPVEVVKASKLYRVSSLMAIRAALIEHLTHMHEMEAA